MSTQEPNGTLGFRMGSAERRLEKLEALEPAVVKSQVHDLQEDVHEIRKDVAWIKRTFIAMCVSFTFFGITLTVLLVNGRHP